MDRTWFTGGSEAQAVGAMMKTSIDCRPEVHGRAVRVVLDQRRVAPI